MTKLQTTLALLALLPAGWASAQEKLSGQATLNVTETMTITVGDSPNHQMFYTRMEGTLKAEGPLNNARYEVVEFFDTALANNGGYKTFTLEDGSKIFARYEVTEPGSTPKGTIKLTGGTEKYAGISGTGSFQGKFNESFTVLEDTIEVQYTMK
ncbi:MAG TPA: hypothetical protein VFQ06_00245 [Nitrospira sp.]|nr:hypothetical protein [Nitrospira sp.]